MKAVSDHVRIADYYLGNKQFENAARAYESAVGCLYESSDMTDLRALDGVSSLSAEASGMDGTHRAVAGLQSSVHDALVSAYGREILEGLDHFVGFKCPGTEHWVVSYHARKQVVLDDLSVPSGRPRVFALLSTKTGVAAWPMPDVNRAQLSYLLAHISWARVDEATRLYMQHQILSDSGVPALLVAAQFLHCALALRPHNAWAHARLGETYRRIANGWPGYGDSLFDPESRVRNYVVALLHYQEAISLAPDAPGAFWVHAHLGAAVVNVRAFAGVVHKPASPALDALLAAWFPGSKPDEAYHQFTLKGQASLVEGQRRAGNYYPWAEVYYSGTLFFEGLGAKEDELAEEMFSFAWLNLAQALHLQPSIAKYEMEPGELYVNAFLQIAQLQFWLRDFFRAWVVTRSGMARLFKFDFLPGVQALQGFQLLINISVEMQMSGRPAAPPPRRILDLLNSEVGRDFSVGGVWIAESPIADRQALVDFVEEVMVKIGEPTIAPVMPSDIILDSGIRMSLLQAYFVFINFKRILDDWGGNTDSVSKCIHEIEAKLGLKATGAAYSAKENKEDSIGEHLTGKPSYRRCSRLVMRTHHASNERKDGSDDD